MGKDERLFGFDRDSRALAHRLGRTLTEVEQIEFVESLMLLETHYEESHQRDRFEAALHGCKLN